MSKKTPEYTTGFIVFTNLKKYLLFAILPSFEFVHTLELFKTLEADAINTKLLALIFELLTSYHGDVQFVISEFSSIL